MYINSNKYCVISLIKRELDEPEIITTEPGYTFGLTAIGYVYTNRNGEEIFIHPAQYHKVIVKEMIDKNFVFKEKGD